jgi:hypothetical protein
VGFSFLSLPGKGKAVKIINVKLKIKNWGDGGGIGGWE